MSTGTPDTTRRPGRAYTFGPRESAGLILGQSAGQLLIIVAILALSLMLMSPSASWPERGVLVAVSAALGGFGWMPVYLGLAPIAWTRLYVAARVQRAAGQTSTKGTVPHATRRA